MNLFNSCICCVLILLGAYKARGKEEAGMYQGHI